MTALTTPTTDDLLAIVDDPSGTPVTKKVTIANLLTLFISNVTVQVLTASSGNVYADDGNEKGSRDRRGRRGGWRGRLVSG